MTLLNMWVRLNLTQFQGTLMGLWMYIVTVSCNVDDGESDTTVVGVEDWYNVDGGAVGGTRQRNNL